MTKKEQLEALSAAADKAMTEAERLFAELKRAHEPKVPPTGGTTPGVPMNAPAFRRRDGRTIKLETPPTTPTPGVVFLIKGGQWTSERPIKLPQIPKA